ncbi:MAG: sugar phosphate isomerase/epimerase [Longimicrobiales bacterium]|nr:sugar phosphate isomerase/epimerase [Longimicrobiales bacterium]
MNDRQPYEHLGVQLYTLREAMAADVDATLARVAEIGYAEVEFAGLHGVSASGMRAKLDREGLSATSSHVGMDLVRSRWSETLDVAQTLGQKLIVVPDVPSDERSAERLVRVADDFNRAGEAAAAVGIRLGYHNHAWEFEPLADGRLPMDLLLDHTEPDLIDWQMDVFWTVQGGADPLAQLARRAGRVRSIHVKDRSPSGDMVDVGDGVIDYHRIIPEGERHGLEHVYVEHDWPDDPFDSVLRSYRHLTEGRGPTPLAPLPGVSRDPFEERIA